MLESINERNSIEEQKATPKRNSFTKTIRFSRDEEDLWQFWNKNTVKKIKDFLRNQLTYKQLMESQIKKSEKPNSEKQKLLKEKIGLIKFIMKKGTSQEHLDRLSKEYSDLYSIQI